MECLSSRREREAPGGRPRENRKFIQAPSPEIWSETISGGEEVLAGKWGGLFWATSLEKIIGGVTAIVSYRPGGRMQQSTVPRCAILSGEARESLAVKRREFITLLGGGAAWPLAARAQQGERMRRIGVLAQSAANDPETAARLTAFVQGLQELGWSVGRNARIEYRWGAADLDLVRRYAAELVALAPDVILAAGGQGVRPLLDVTTTVPIVFDALDPVGAGFVASLARPGGNATGFGAIEFGMSAKWLELLKQIAPHITRVAVLPDPINIASIGQFSALQAVAPSFGVELTPVNLRDAGEIERGITAFARGSNEGVILTA